MKVKRQISREIEVAAAQHLKERDYWLKKLFGDRVNSTFPHDIPGTPSPLPILTEFACNWEGGFVTQLMEISKHKEHTLHVILLTGMTALLYKYTGNTDIILGTPIYRQVTPGELINTALAIRNLLKPGVTFKELLLQVKQAVLEALENQAYPLEMLPGLLSIPESEKESPFFKTALLLDNIHDRHYLNHIPLEMIFRFLRTDNRLEMKIEYDAALYGRASVERIAAHFNRLLQKALSYLDIRISEIDILSDDEKQKLLVEFNDTAAEYPHDKTIYQLFAEQVETGPDHIALAAIRPLREDREQNHGMHSRPGTFPMSYLSYKKINELALDLGGVLKVRGCKPDTIIGLMALSTLEALAAILGIVKAGGAYLPINPAFPAERIDYMLADSRAELVISDNKQVGTGQCPVPLLDIGDIRDRRGTDHWNGGNRHACSDGPATRGPQPVTNPSNLAYIIYTSGTTGRPKGVMVTHKNVIRLVRNNGFVEFRAGDHIMQTGALEFDASTFEIWGAFLNGHTLFVAPQEKWLHPGILKKIVTLYRITLMWMTSLLFNRMVQEDVEIFAGLTRLLVGGDVLSPPHINKVRQRYPRLKIINGYGPTENTTFSTTFLIRQEYTDNIPIGKPITNSTAYIVDRDNCVLPVLVPGELLVGGEGVARGYMNNPELTAEKFLVTDGHRRTQATINQKLLPGVQRGGFLEKSPSGRRRLYRTGDLACWQPEGNIRFLGRIDHQVKIRGFRIELAEIENHLLLYPGVKEAVVTVPDAQDGDKNLAAYVAVGTDPTAAPVKPDEIREYLAVKLPDFMIPTFIIIMEKLPLASTGKIDRKSLPPPQINTGDFYIAPRDKIEMKLAELYSELLGIPNGQIGIGTHFFKAGGHSLKATRLIAGIHKTFHVIVSLIDVFKHPTIKELARHIAEGEENRFVSINPVEVKEYYVLSSAQKRLYILNRMETGSTNYNIPVVYVPEEEPDIKQFEEAIREMIRRHESFRTSFLMIGDEPVQRIHPDVEFNPVMVDGAVPAPETGPITTRSLTDVIQGLIRPFDLSRAPLLRVGVIKTGKGKSLLLVDMHHIISDGVSVEIFKKELQALYHNRQLPALGLQYKDYAQWQQKEVDKERVKAQENFWFREFAGEIPLLNLPLDNSRPAIQRFTGSKLSFILGNTLTAGLKRLAAEHKTTLFMVLFAVFDILLMKLSGQEDVVVGTPVAGRRHSQLEGIIGMFVNTLALRSYPSGEKTWEKFLAEVKSGTLDAFENQEYPFEELVSLLVSDRNAGRNPIFDVMFVLQNMETGETPRQSLFMNTYEMQTVTAKFDITLMAWEKNDDLQIIWEYCTLLFKEETLKRFDEYFRQIIQAILGNSKTRIKDITILTEAEKQRILEDFNDTIRDYPRDKTLDELFRQQVEKNPDQVTLVGRNRFRECQEKNRERSYSYSLVYISYGKLNEQSTLLARELTRGGVGPDSIIGIMLKRSIEMLVGVLGIVKAGGAYLPINPEFPADRIGYMLADSSAALTISDRTHVGTEQCSVPILVIGDLKENQGAEIEDAGKRLASSDNLAYIIYTSGSTGRPKGVMVTHRNVIRLVQNTNYVEFNPGERLLQTGALEFDASTFEIWGAILNGLSLYLEPKEILLNPVILERIISDHMITTMWMTVSWYNQMVQEKAGILAGLRNLLVGGDVLSPVHINKAQQQYPRLKIINGYGPTENTTFSTTFLIDREYPENIPIGKPIANSTAYIVDKHNFLQPIGIVGELLVGGEGVSRGYMNNPELTAEKFLFFYHRTHKSYLSYKFFNSNKLYKTGDLACWQPDGNIRFQGRIDHQVKIRGYRIELGEIENQLVKHPGVKEACVTVVETQRDNKTLAAYLTVGTISLAAPAKIDEIRDYLVGKLPDFMIPTFIILMEKLPLATTGKINRNALPQPVVSTSENDTAPRDRIETKLVALYSELLGIPPGQIGIDTHFFKAGGHSLKATRLISKVHKILEVTISLGDIFSHPTIRELARYINEANKKPYQPIPPVEKKEFYPVSPIQKRFFLVDQMEGIGLAYNLAQVFTVEGSLNTQRLELAFQLLVQRHESLRTSFEVVEGQLVQRIHATVLFSLERIDVPLNEHTSAPILSDLIIPSIKTFIRPFDLSRAPMLRAGLVTLPGQKYILVVDIHHIVSDGTSQGILYRDLLALYDNRELPELTVQYKDYSQWQRTPEQEEEKERQSRYWLRRYEQKLPGAGIFTDFTRPQVQSFKGTHVEFHLDHELVEKIHRLRQETGTTLYMILLAVYSLLLSKYIGLEDVTVGCVVAGRQHVDLHNQIGLFINALPLRNFPESRLTFAEYLEEVKQDTLNAFENQGYPFDYLLEKLEIEVEMSRNPIFDVELILINMEQPVLAADEFKLIPNEESVIDATQVDLALYAMETPRTINFNLYYSADLFKPSTIDHFIDYFKEILVSVVSDQSIKLRDINLSYNLNETQESIYTDMESDLEF